MKPSSAMALASRMSGHSALACALAGTDFAVVAVIAANAADRRRSRFVNIRTFLLTADACVHKVVLGAVFVLIYVKTAFAKPCEMGHSHRFPRANRLKSGWTIQARTGPLSHRSIFKIHDPVWRRAKDEFSDKGASDVILLDRAKPSRNQTPQPCDIARRVSIACDNTGAKNREALEADPSNRLFLQPHDPHIANPAFRGASHGREQRKSCDTPGLTTSGEATDHANLEGL